jgi:hypothetical protein
MDAQFLVRQLRFARSEMMRCLEGVSEADALVRIQPMNSIGWIVGHLAAQEQFFWIYAAQQKALYPQLYQRVGFGQPASTPDLTEMLQVWGEITASADEYLDKLTPELLLTHLAPDGSRSPENVGTLLLRNTYHYWFHTGEAHAIRQQLGHRDLPQFVGDLTNAKVNG